jgi:AraC-like DNA-binding protein
MSHSIAPMDVCFQDSPGALDEIVTGSVGVVEVVRYSSGAGEVRRTARHIRESDPDVWQLYVQTKGTAIAAQDGREVELTPGDLSLTDLSRPFSCKHPAREVVLLRFPRSQVPVPRRDLATVIGRRISGQRGTGALVAAVAREIPQHLDDASGIRMGSALLDLLAAAIASELDCAATLTAETRHRARVMRIAAFIEAHLGDADLTPSAVADAHHISVRYLHKIFSAEPMTVAGHIRGRRLERCWRDLVDPAFAQWRVNAIARRWGYTNAAHFNRAFRDAYGMPPGEFRMTHVARGPQC